jgi:hypothetical protein
MHLGVRLRRRLDPPLTPLGKGENPIIGSPPFEGGFRGIKLGLEATHPTLKYARLCCIDLPCIYPFFPVYSA